MLRSLPLILLLCCFFTARAQQPDSTLYNGEWYFVYPISEQVNPNMDYLQKVGLIEAEFALYRSWQKNGDPRGTLHGRRLHRAMEKELIASKRITADEYIRKRAVLQRERWKAINPYISLPIGGQSVTYSLKKKTRRHPGLLINQEIDVEYDLVPYVGDLPDGRYIQYFDDFYSYRRQRKMKPNAPHIACVFELNENQLNGSYRRYSYVGDTLRTGSFVHGQREGAWLITGKKEVVLRSAFRSFWNVSWIAHEHDYVLASFHDGMLNGHYEHWENGELALSGNYERGRMTGEWFRRQGKSLFAFQLQFDLPSEQELINNPDTTRVLNLWETEELAVPKSESSTERISGYLKGRYILELQYMEKYMGHSLKPLFEDLPLVVERRSADYSLTANYPFRSYLSGHWVDLEWTDGGEEPFNVYTPAFRYRIDPQIHAILGSHYYPGGNLCDTIGFDPVNEQFFRKMYDANGRLCYERTWNRQASVLSTKEYKLTDSNVVLIEGLEASLSLFGRSDYRYTWANMDDSVIGTKNYNYIIWASATGPRLVEEYVDTLTGEEVQIEYNRFGEVSQTTISTYEGKQFKKISALYREVRWGELKIVQDMVKTADDKWTEHSIVYKNDLLYTGKLVLRSAAFNEYRFTRDRLEINVARMTGKYVRKKDPGNGNQDAGLPQASLERTGANAWSQLFRSGLGYIGQRDIETLQGEIVNGKLSGNWQFYDKEHRLLFELDYDAEGKPSGVYREYDTKLKSPRYLRKNSPFYSNVARYRPVAAHTTRYVKKSYTLEHGIVNGSRCVYNFRGDTIELQNYEHGVLHGRQVAYTENKIATMQYDHGVKKGDWSIVNYSLFMSPTGGGVVFDTVTSFHLDANGQLDGTTFYASLGSLRTAVFHAGVLDGPLVIKDGGTLLPEADFLFRNGWLLQKSRWHNGEVSVVYTCSENDSVTLFDYALEGQAAYMGISDGSFQFERYSYDDYTTFNHITDELSECYFTKLDPMGKPARRGQLKETHKTGTWEFFAYGGKLLYTIDYTDSVYPINGGNYYTKGIWSEFDSLGNVLSRRLVIGEEEKYTCADDDYYAVREFITIEDRPDTLERTNGMIRNYYDDGMLMSEGVLENGFPVGVWKFYTPDGKLYRVGRYENGLKEGRWLSGDLADKKYIGDICLNPDDANLDMHIAQLERELDIEVENYKKGIVQGHQLYTIEK